MKTNRTYCNPTNISYKYQHGTTKKPIAYREGADPTLVEFGGKYYLFISMNAGFYYSDDMINWKYHENRNLEILSYAPDARQIGDNLYFCASEYFKKSKILRTKDPLSDNWELVSAPLRLFDPNLFEDDDKRVYLYWGCSNKKPLWGIEMDAKTLQPIGEKQGLIRNDIENIGWERFNILNDRPKPENLLKDLLTRQNLPYLEGAYMTKHDGKYYLQYAAPATEQALYGNGVYVSDNPFGPFERQKHTPFSLMPRGFVAGAGHGSTIKDLHGNYWHISTIRISVSADFERRVGIWPCGFDKDGLLYCNQNFGDWPMEIPEGKFAPEDIKPKYMLLSYKKSSESSSHVDGHGSELAVDENIKTCWQAKNGSGEWYSVDLGEICEIQYIQVNFADLETPGKKKREIESGIVNTLYTIEASIDKREWALLFDNTKENSDLPHNLIEVNGSKYRYIKVTAKELPFDQKMTLSGLRVFGKGSGHSPIKVVDEIRVTEKADLDVRLKWRTIPDVVGYNVRIGIAPDKLYTSYMVYGENSVRITILNRGEKYYAAVDGFNENGITEGEVCFLPGIAD